MEINFLVTCYDKEDYLMGLKEVMNSYRKIKPNMKIAYNGNINSFPCDIKIQNRGHQLGDIDLTLNAYNSFRNGVSKFVKLGIDSWLLNEDIVIDIFNELDSKQACYAGNYWFENSQESLSTDIFFSNIEYGNIFENFIWDGKYFETSLFASIKKMNSKILIINEREPVHPANRFKVIPLSWTMSHSLKENLSEYWHYHYKR